MGEAHVPQPVLLIIAAFSNQEDALVAARERLVGEFGPVALAGSVFEFNHTRYYEATMGLPLRKQLVAFAQLVSADSLARIKQRTNALENELARTLACSSVRPLNLDPGLLSLGKFVLATTKDQAHRIYVGEGIYAEVTLRYSQHSFEPWPWTYADYREPHVRAFLKEARNFYRAQLDGLSCRSGV